MGKIGSRGVVSCGDDRGKKVGKVSIDDGETGLRNAGMDMLRILASNLSSLGGVLRDIHVGIASEWQLLVSWRKYWT